MESKTTKSEMSLNSEYLESKLLLKHTYVSKTVLV